MALKSDLFHTIFRILDELKSTLDDKSCATLTEESWGILENVLVDLPRDKLAPDQVVSLRTNLTSKPHINQFQQQIDEKADEIIEPIRKQQTHIYSTRTFCCMAKLCARYGNNPRKFLILAKYFENLDYVDDEEMTKVLFETAIASEDWKLTYLLCMILGRSSNLRLTVSKYILKSKVKDKVGRFIYSNIRNFTFQSYLIELVGLTLPKRKVTVGDSFVSKLWDKHMVPETLWVEFPFAAQSGQQSVLSYMKHVSKIYCSLNSISTSACEFMSMVSMDIFGKHFEYYDENHIIVQVRGSCLHIWYPHLSHYGGEYDDNKFHKTPCENCDLQLLELNLNAMACSPAVAPGNFTLYLDAESTDLPYAAMDIDVVWKKIKLTLFPPTEKMQRDVLREIWKYAPPSEPRVAHTENRIRLDGKMRVLENDNGVLKHNKHDPVHTPIKASNRLAPVEEESEWTSDSDTEQYVPNTPPQSNRETNEEPACLTPLNDSLKRSRNDSFASHEDANHLKRRNVSQSKEISTLPSPKNTQSDNGPSPAEFNEFTVDDTTIFVNDNEEHLMNGNHAPSGEAATSSPKLKTQRTDDLPRLQNHDPSQVLDDLSEYNDQIYNCLKTSARKLTRKLDRLEKKVLDRTQSSGSLLRYLKEQAKYDEIKRKQQESKNHLATFVQQNKWKFVTF